VQDEPLPSITNEDVIMEDIEDHPHESSPPIFQFTRTLKPFFFVALLFMLLGFVAPIVNHLSACIRNSLYATDIDTPSKDDLSCLGQFLLYSAHLSMHTANMLQDIKHFYLYESEMGGEGSIEMSTALDSKFETYTHHVEKLMNDFRCGRSDVSFLRFALFQHGLLAEEETFQFTIGSSRGNVIKTMDQFIKRNERESHIINAFLDVVN